MKTTTRPGDAIEVEGGTLPLDPNTVWRRVAGMLDSDVGPPSTVRLENLSSVVSVRQSPFERALGVPHANRTGVAGVAPRSWSGSLVQLHRGLVDDRTSLEATLAHEYVHVAQMRTRAYSGVLRTIDEDDEHDYSPDEQLAWTAVIEGSAAYVEERYARRHLDSDGGDDRRRYLNATTTSKLLFARYSLGAAYVNATVEDPSEIERVYENPPRTTEELLHGLEPGSEPPRPLSVSATADRRVERSGPYGELYVRTLFGTALNETAAERLADGWGNDTRLNVGGSRDDASGDFAWVLRWDDAANATEFERGVAAYLDAREPEANVRVERVAPETTVMFVGNESFVANASASGENASVTVSP